MLVGELKDIVLDFGTQQSSLAISCLVKDIQLSVDLIQECQGPFREGGDNTNYGLKRMGHTQDSKG